MAPVRALRPALRRHGAPARRRKAAAGGAALEPVRDTAAAPAGAAWRLPRIRGRRQVSFPCRDPPAVYRPDRWIPGMAGSTGVIAPAVAICEANGTIPK